MRKEWEGDSSSAQDKLVSNEFINEWMAALIASNRNRSHFTEELICGRMLLWLSFSLTWLDLLCFILLCFFIIHPRQYLKAATSWLEKFTVFSLQLSAIIVKQLERSFDSFWLINHTHEWLGRAASRAESESKSSRTRPRPDGSAIETENFTEYLFLLLLLLLRYACRLVWFERAVSDERQRVRVKLASQYRSSALETHTELWAVECV